MSNYNILFVGYGIIGHQQFELFKNLKPDIYDKFSTSSNTKRNIKYDFAFIAVPTETIDGKCDISAVETAVQETDAKVIIFKSAIIPGTCRYFANKYPDKKFICCPVFSGATQHNNTLEYNYSIIGGEPEVCHQVQQMMQHAFNASHQFRITTWETAEVLKYMDNCFLGTKVNFCNAFWEISKQYNIDYDELREYFIMDPRVGPYHTFVYDDAPYWNSHCLEKDISAFFNETGNKFLKNLIEYNSYLKDKY